MVDVGLRNRGRTAALAVAFVLVLTTVAFAAGVNAADTSVPVVFIASGENYPDGLVSGSAAGVSGGPVLLVTKDGIPAETAAELVRLNPDKIYIAGGTAAITAGVETQLAAYAPVVARLWGNDRYATAAAISEAIFPATIGGVPGPEGPAGADGTDGTDGTDGADSTVPGPKGDTGDPGVMGFYTVESTANFTAGDIAAHALCDIGDSVTGGGYLVVEEGVDYNPRASNPLGTDIWGIVGSVSLTTDVVVYAMCADVALPAHTP